MSFCSQPLRVSRFQKGAKYPALPRLFLAVLFLTAIQPSEARSQASERLHLALGPAVVPGVGFLAGTAEVSRMLTREASFAIGYRSSREGSIRASLTFGGAIRVFGVQRTVFGGTSRSMDLDIGLRLGPAVLFRFEESDLERNKRFTLVADPFVRFIAGGRVLLFLEFGIHRPAIRAGVWLPV